MDQLQDHNLFDLEVSEETKSNLTAIPLWMNITAITALAGAAISIFTTIMTISKYGSYGFSMATLVVPLISLAITLLLNITLLGAAKHIKLALNSGEQYMFNEGMRRTANYFRIYGVILICALALCVLLVIFGIIVGAAGGFGR